MECFAIQNRIADEVRRKTRERKKIVCAKMEPDSRQSFVFITCQTFYDEERDDISTVILASTKKASCEKKVVDRVAHSNSSSKFN